MDTAASNAGDARRFLVRRHLNKLRWLSLTTVFTMLVLLPFLHVYQTFVAAHAYDLIAPSEKQLYDAMEALTSPFISNPETDLDAIKGNTWSGNFWGLQLSDPLAFVGQSFAGRGIHWAFALTALIPIGFTLVFGRFFCGWICPATLLYELNTQLAKLLGWAGMSEVRRRLDRRFKYVVLAMGLVVSAVTGSVLVGAIYPPAIIGRDLYYAVAFGGVGAGTVFFLATLLFDLLVARRGFCRYVCPGGALYSLLGRYRAVRIRRVVEDCNDCAKCNAICEFGLDPLRDGFGQECNNCTACMAVCPTDALVFSLRLNDYPEQGPGHLGRRYLREQSGRESEAAMATGEVSQ